MHSPKTYGPMTKPCGSERFPDLDGIQKLDFRKRVANDGRMYGRSEP